MKQIFEVKGSDLTKIRVKCLNQECGAVTEIEVSKINQVFEKHQCPVCGHDFDLQVKEGASTKTTPALKLLAEFFTVLNNAIEEKFEIEFPVEVKND